MVGLLFFIVYVGIVFNVLTYQRQRYLFRTLQETNFELRRQAYRIKPRHIDPKRKRQRDTEPVGTEDEELKNTWQL